jgi:hypothetical protein
MFPIPTVLPAKEEVPKATLSSPKTLQLNELAPMAVFLQPW